MAGPRSRREGYIFVDHRASPGLTAAEARLAGYDPAQVGEGAMMEAGTLTCSHCKAVVVKNHKRERERASCAKCGFHYICDGCALSATLPDYTHMPFDKFTDLTLSGRQPIVLMKPSVEAPPVLILPPMLHA